MISLQWGFFLYPANFFFAFYHYHCGTTLNVPSMPQGFMAAISQMLLAIEKIRICFGALCVFVLAQEQDPDDLWEVWGNVSPVVYTWHS
ncbi:hypothetical protein T06_2106 [Trichinella sp. T6]|nr:hypothetical protein T06_13015 [Trichinella sp. T6]KRX83024.1 hypothetical protein T06_2106 [Trichinella sp. T6]